MKVWEFRNSSLNEVAPLVFADESELVAGMFDVDGRPIVWGSRPHAEVFVDPRRKKVKPRVDISALRPGAFVLNAKAKAALGEFLGNFGQLLEIDVDGQSEWFYNVTHLVDCIDPENSVIRASGSIAKEAFLVDRIPVNPAVFKDPRTARTRIYVNDGAKDILLDRMQSVGISGAEFAEPGMQLSRPRPTA
jgi:hypothetical protein